MQLTVDTQQLRACEPACPKADSHDDLARLAAEISTRWWRTPTELPDLGAEVSRWQKRRKEREIDRFADRLEAVALSQPDGPGEQSAGRGRLRDLLRDFGARVVALPEAESRVILSDAYFEATANFARQAQAFDSGLGLHDLSQALRNVWIMHLIQLLLDREISLTPSIFAYSMLYPYTDNPLDDSALTTGVKEDFCRQLGRRLAGEWGLSGGPRLRDVFRLIDRIEEEYPRRQFPSVYASLLAIHRAQVRSLAQKGGSLCEARILGISVEKGGASVLADGYLVAGELTRQEVDFFFAYGVFLQLADDLQDLEQDLRAGHQTIFSRAARAWPLDRLVNRLVHFLDAVLQSARFSAPRFAVLKSLIRRSCVQLVVAAVGQQPKYFTRDYLRTLERHSLTRFSYARNKHGALMKRTVKLNEALAQGTRFASIFEAMG